MYAFSIRILALLPLLVPTLASACAGCRNPNMPVTRVEAANLRKGEFRLGGSLGATRLHIIHEAGCEDLNDCNEIPVQPLYLHDQVLFPAELRVFGEYGLSPSWGVELQVPMRMVKTSVDYTTPNGDSYDPLDEGVHHRHETLVGFGDPHFFLRYFKGLNKISLSLKVGTTLPLGSTEEDPFELGDRGEEHQHIQFGTGTFNPLLEADVSVPLKKTMITVFISGQASFYENDKGFQAGPRMSGGLLGGRKIFKAVTGTLGLEGMYEGPEKWGGRVAQDGNLGRTEILGSLGLMHKLQKLGDSMFGFTLRTPFYRYIEPGDEDPGSISAPVMGNLVFSTKLNL